MTTAVTPLPPERGHADLALAKAATLIEALPWLSRFHGQTVVIKYGGNAMTEDDLRVAFAQDVVFLRHAGLRPVIVHGGGPQISAHLDRLGVPSTFTAGLRVTTAETMDVVRMVLTGQVNRDLVGLINRHGPFAIGLSGEDANMFTAVRRGAVVDGEPVDLGLVGEIDMVDPGAVLALIRDGRVPVVSSVARGEDGEVYNVNADTAAAALAVALDAAKLVMLTDVEGLYADWRGPEAAAGQEVISLLNATELEDLLPGLGSGMIPKMEACLRAVRGGVPAGARARRPAAARGAAGDLHRLRHRHHGRPGRAPARRNPAMSATERLQARFEAALMPNYGLPPLALTHGQGCRVWDADGREYTDLIGRHRGQLAGARPPGPGRGGHRAGGQAGPHLQPVPARDGGRAGRTAARAARRGRHRPGLLRQLRHRGQ